LRQIDGFSHLWLIFDFSKAHQSEFCPLVRPPRLGGNEKVGGFASRSPFRPNSLRLSSVKLIKVEDSVEFGKTLLVSGADILDGSPIFDVKPYIPFSDCHIDAVGGYADLKKEHSLEVDFPKKLQEKLPKEKINAIIECLSDDPRPSYQDDGRVYGMTFAQFNIKFTVKENLLTVIEVEQKT
jgi:tRNA-Thr(GGU) m(6)t(6)A37 methyltransferase TsaA